jgi:hypothetical protein
VQITKDAQKPGEKNPSPVIQKFVFFFGKSIFLNVAQPGSLGNRAFWIWQ